MPDRSELAKAKGKQPRQTWISQALSYAAKALIAPLQLVLLLLAAGLRPIAPQLIPLVVLLLAAPVLLVPALFSGLYVWNSGAVGWEAPLSLQYGDGISPYAEVIIASLSSEQPYDIFLHLVVPATESNYALGNFMASMTLTGPSNRTLASVRHPAIVLPPSPYQWTTPKTAELHIPLMSAYVTGANRVVARVELGRRDHWKSIGLGQGRELSVLSASIEGVVRYQGIRGIVSRYPFISAVVATMTFFTVSLLILAACLLPAIRWQYLLEEEKPPAAIKAEPDLVRKASQEILGEKRLRTRRSFKRSASQGRGDLDASVSNIPPADSSAMPLRRRRSRLSEHLSESD